MDRLDDLAWHFQRFAEVQCDHSPLYRRLAAGVALDRKLLNLAARAQSQPKANLLFAAVHYLLLKGAEHELSRFYPSVIQGAPSPDEPFPHFRAFCFAHEDEIEHLLRTRRVQTNEVARAAFLLPAFHYLSRVTGKPLALVEVGTSAGLLLAWDRYRLDYGQAGQGGDPGSPVHIRCEVRGHRPMPLPAVLPLAGFRSGIDLNPIDLKDPEEALWLRALVWGDQTERAQRLAQAIAIVAAEGAPLIRGDAVAVLPDVLAQIPEEDVTRVVYHCHTLNQFPQEARQRFADLLAHQSEMRDLYQLSLEAIGGSKYPEMRLTRFRRGQRADHRLLARYEPHGAWIEWLG